MNLFDVIRSPIVSEKTSGFEGSGKYSFVVMPNSNKSKIKEAIESIFSVKVSKVNIVNQKGKVKKFKGRVGRRSDVKKAFVTLSNGSTIDLSNEF
ncbi:MAG TPA: 50S ribosomal protein L23 [Candidatus Megaira endosymbiont of Hartmannula sinica]|nr:50S ribosomal protein L23 [Candidatus Megaera endosymbiont of Hartmannula sinica]